MTTSLIDGVGGMFVFSADPARLARWYAEHLGITFEGAAGEPPFYAVYWSRAEDDPSRRVDTSFSILTLNVPPTPRASAAEPTTPDAMYGDRAFMVNFRVRDLDALLAHLAVKAVHPLARQDESYGRFAWILDADGHRVELYQPLPQSG
ncbi:MAG: VOC family protein [Myxococcota bacterium]|nr:VOC family protein [Myxococcota bacterium]